MVGLGAQTVWMSPSTPAFLVHEGAAAQSAHELGEYISEGVVINEYALSQSDHWSHCFETAEPITVMHDDNISTNEESPQEMMWLSGWMVQSDRM